MSKPKHKWMKSPPKDAAEMIEYAQWQVENSLCPEMDRMQNFNMIVSGVGHRSPQTGELEEPQLSYVNLSMILDGMPLHLIPDTASMIEDGVRMLIREAEMSVVVLASQGFEILMDDVRAEFGDVESPDDLPDDFNPAEFGKKREIVTLMAADEFGAFEVSSGVIVRDFDGVRISGWERKDTDREAVGPVAACLRDGIRDARLAKLARLTSERSES